MTIWHLGFASPTRGALYPDEAQRRRAVLALVRVAGQHLVLFSGGSASAAEWQRSGPLRLENGDFGPEWHRFLPLRLENGDFGADPCHCPPLGPGPP